MICISIAQESRRFALVDMHNSARQCDLLEVRLDRFGKAPEIAELLAAKPKPVIFSCRRVQDGGNWEGTEEERQTILRQCIISKADYVEIELDIADQIRKFPPAKRVISYTNLRETPADLPQIYAEALRKSPDVIKIVTLIRTPEEAWPLVQILAKPQVPTVAVGLGKAGVMLSILGKRIGAPWTYAALERGMEAYPGQPTVNDLQKVYHYGAIDKSTRFIGVTGFHEVQFANVAVLNAALAGLGVKQRCLPLPMGDLKVFRKVMDAVKLAGVVVDEDHRSQVLELAREAQAADLLVPKDEGWQAYHTLCRGTLAALEAALKDKAADPDKPLAGRMCMIVGTNGTARGMAFAVKKRGGVPIIAGRDVKAALHMAQAFECRHVQWEALYSTMHDVLIYCSDDAETQQLQTRKADSTLHAGFLRPNMAVCDLTQLPRRSYFHREARLRGCVAVEPRDLLLRQFDLQVRFLTGKEVPDKLLADALRESLGEDEE
jgi:3-dehydroquinate dehydratase/shikimate dehydrogenase